MGIFSRKPSPAERDASANSPAEAVAGDPKAAKLPPGAKRAPDPRDVLGGVNNRTKKRQSLYLAAGSAVVLIAGSMYVFSGNDKPKGFDPTKPIEVKIDTDAMTGKNMADAGWRQKNEILLNEQNTRLKAVEGQNSKVSEMAGQIATLQQQNEAMKADGQRVLQVYQTENTKLRAQAASASAGGAGGTIGTPGGEPFRVAGGSPPAYGPAGGYDQQGRPIAAGGPAGAPGMAGPAEVKTISFIGASGATGTAGGAGAPIGFRGEHPDAPPTVIEDSPDYLPPNSYATARVIVGVDASAGVSSQTDPLPVVLRITGPARSVINNGKVLTTRLEGCVVNGAARGDLSAEKVYVKLAKMTCDQPGGRVAVSEVKGFISFGGKTGVRGRVVTREGGLIGQAFLAGIAGGFGRGFSANANALFQGAQTVINGERQQLSPGELAKAGLGQGVAQSADMVSKYLIQRAEQYQPVIEMPTGIEVEIVFLDGVYVRSSK